MTPEVYLAREIGACYTGIYIVVNYAEGVYPEWDYGKFRSLFYEASLNMANILVAAAHRLATESYECDCKDLRKPTLLK
jgi:5'-methylthioadenosine phosphorylase